MGERASHAGRLIIQPQKRLRTAVIELLAVCAVAPCRWKKPVFFFHVTYIFKKDGAKIDTVDVSEYIVCKKETNHQSSGTVR